MPLGSISEIDIAFQLETPFPRRGRGRPPSPQGTRKDERLQIKVTEARKEEIEQLAKQLGLSVSALFEKALVFFEKKGLHSPKKTDPT